MNRSIPLILLIATVSLFSCKGRGDTAVDTPEADTVVVEEVDTVTDTVPRTSITFILGEDNSTYNQYYTLANHYYRLSREDRTDVVVENLTALSQVLDYLRKHPADNGRPYGLVNLVSHGNEFIDLQATVTPWGGRLSPQTLCEALRKKKLVPPDSMVADSLTVVFLHGCAVGQNQALLDGLAEAFGGRAMVKASKLFEYYAYLSRNQNPGSVRRYFARTWYAFYHPDSAFDEKGLVRQLRRRYPHDTTHWREGLRRRFQDNPSEVYHYSFIVPCSYTEVYGAKEDLPNVNSRSRREQWIAEHPDYKALLAITNIPEKYFQTKFYRQTFQAEGDSLLYGLRVKARAGVVCLIQPLVTTDAAGYPYAPYRPAEDDTLIFAYSRPVQTLSSCSARPIL